VVSDIPGVIKGFIKLTLKPRHSLLTSR